MSSPPPDLPTEPTDPTATSRFVRAAQAGNPEAVTWVIERFTPPLLAAARRRLGWSSPRAQDAEDLTQEVWAVALRRLPDLEPRDRRLTPVFLRFLASTLWRRHASMLRQKLRRQEPEQPALPSSRIADTATSIVAQLVRSEACTRVLAALDVLGPEDRDLVILRAVEQVPNQLVAQQLGLSPGTASARYCRALARLRASIPNSFFEDLDES